MNSILYNYGFGRMIQSKNICMEYEKRKYGDYKEVNNQLLFQYRIMENRGYRQLIGKLFLIEEGRQIKFKVITSKSMAQRFITENKISEYNQEKEIEEHQENVKVHIAQGQRYIEAEELTGEKALDVGLMIIKNYVMDSINKEKIKKNLDNCIYSREWQSIDIYRYKGTYENLLTRTFKEKLRKIYNDNNLDILTPRDKKNISNQLEYARCERSITKYYYNFENIYIKALKEHSKEWYIKQIKKELKADIEGLKQAKKE